MVSKQSEDSNKETKIQQIILLSKNDMLQIYRTNNVRKHYKDIRVSTVMLFKESQIIEYILQNGTITAQSFALKFGAKIDTVSRRLRRMREQGKLQLHKDGRKSDWFYTLPDKIDVNLSDADSIYLAMIKFMQDTKHENLNNFSKKLGGNQKGGGHSGAYRSCLDVLAEMVKGGFL